MNITFKIPMTSANHSDGHLQSILRCTSCIRNLSLPGIRSVRPEKIYTSPINSNDRRYDGQIILGQVRAQGLRPRMHVSERFLDPLFRVYETESVTVQNNFWNPHSIYPTALGSLNPKIGWSAVVSTIRNPLPRDAFREPITWFFQDLSGINHDNYYAT